MNRQVEELVALGLESGLDAVGVAPAEPFESTRRDLEDRKAQGLHGGMSFTYRNPARSTDPGRALPEAKALVVGARSYLRPVPPQGNDRPEGRVARYALTDYYSPLRDALGQIADRLRSQGWRARVLADDNALVDREAARRAGLGWYGKNANLLLPGTGSWFVLGSVVTDAPLPTTEPDQLPPDGCGTCTRCLDGCPTGAIVAPGVVDARRCLAWLLQMDGAFPREHRAALGDRIYGCDDCQEVCPPNRRAERRSTVGIQQQTSFGTAAEPADADPTGPKQPDLEPWADLLAMLELGDDELLHRYGRWYIPRREPRYLRRNALVVLGNVGDPADERVVSALRKTLAADDPLIRAHAVWAARRMGRDDLLTESGSPYDDPDPLVQDELASPTPPR